MKSVTYLLLTLLLVVSCKTKRPEISSSLPKENTRTVFHENPDWNINVATINTFSIPVLPPLRQERISLIGDTIDNNKLDYVSIQEAFSDSVREKLYGRSRMPYRSYFNVKGSVGSGMVMLSKYPLLNKTFWYHLLMGRKRDAEFWSGKGIAKATIHKNGLDVNVYNIHLLSRLSKNSDESVDYNSVDRLSELFEVFTQIVEQRDSDAFILLGDFNMNLYNKEFDFFRNLTGLKGSLFQLNNRSACTYCRGNTFNSKSEGQLDYIWISPRLKFNTMEIFMEKTYVIDGTPTNLSDHYGVKANVGINQIVPYQQSNSLMKENTLKEIKYLKDVLLKDLVGKEPFPKEYELKGAAEHLCRSCRIKDVVALTNDYIKALQPKYRASKLTERQKVLRKRLELYFSLF